MPATFDIAAIPIAGMARSYGPAATTGQKRDFRINRLNTYRLNT